jgi:hypothetical protein
MKITGTFIDEISHDIPHQNWGPREWDRDFSLMKRAGITRVIMIRCGYKKWMTFPSEVLRKQVGVFNPPSDLVSLFLDLADKHEMEFYFGLYDSGNWPGGDMNKELDLGRAVVDEVWQLYGKRSAFRGWYISQEINRKTPGMIELIGGLGAHCKAVSGGLTTLISPYIDGIKNISQYDRDISRNEGISIEDHRREWGEIFEGIASGIDVVAFQDGHVEFDELTDFLRVNKQLADQHGLACWTNTESFDRDMPIKFLPIKWEKLWLKMKMAENAGISEAITFEFSHFMSPQSAYLQAGHLYNRYLEYLDTIK